MKTSWSAVLPAPVVFAADQNGACAAALGCFARIRVWQMKNITEALALCEEVIRDCKKLRSRELRQLIEDYVNAQKEILEALRRKVN